MALLSNLQKVIGALIFLVIIFFGFFHITESPPYAFDEGWAVQMATNISQLGIDGTQIAPGQFIHTSVVSVGYPLLYVLAFWFKVFGVGIFQARAMMVIYMLGFSAISFLFLRRLYGNTIALSSLAILSVFPPFYTFGKEVIGEVPVLFFLMLSLLFFNLAINNPNRRRFLFIMCGVAGGLCIATKTMALVLIPVLVLAAIVAFMRRLVSWGDIGIVAMSAIVPIIVWAIVNFQIGDSLSSVMNYYSNPAAVTDRFATFWTNIRILLTTIGGLYALSLIFIWLTGIVIRLRAKTRIHVEEFIALIFSVLILASFMFRYPDARYLFPVQALGILFLPYSLSLIFKNKIYSIIVIILCIAGLYQVSFNSYVADYYNSTYTKDLSKYMSSIPEYTPIFFHSATHVVTMFHGQNYYQRIALFNKWFIGSDLLETIKSKNIEMLVLYGEIPKEDERIAFDNFTKVAEFKKVTILKRKVR